MSRLDTNTQIRLLKEAKVYFRDMMPIEDLSVGQKKEVVALTQEHIEEWLEVFYDDRIKLDGCNFATVKR